MKIAQVSPLFESVPPKKYGGTERIVSYLTESLVKRGHDVTLFASGDSQTAARLVSGSPEALRLDPNRKDSLAYHVRLIEYVFQRAADFDLIHMHLDYLPFPMSRRSPTPVLSTLHGRLDLPDLAPLYQEFRDLPLVSISDAQRQPLSGANWLGTVYHGMPGDTYKPCFEPENYLAFLGRISPEKQVDRAIALAERLKRPLKVAAKIEPLDIDYYYKVRPLLENSEYTEYLGEIHESAKNDFLGKAQALIFLIDWPEPFGLVMIEAMACGTPVIARRCGAVPEIVEDGVTGFLVENDDEAAAAIQRVGELDRRTIRRRFEERFTDERMVDGYLALYKRILVSPYPLAAAESV